jgi:DNA-binding NarL/FixJ family response regulator
LYQVSPRQREIAERVAQGASAAEVAAELNLSSHTVRQHLKAVYQALHVASGVELAWLLAHPTEAP